MRHNALARYYDRLEPRERFELMLEALSRGDKQEALRLNNTCPRGVYVIDDPTFSELREASKLVASVFAIFWLQAERDFRVAEAMVKAYGEVMASFARGWVQGANHAWERAGKPGELYHLEDVLDEENGGEGASTAATAQELPATLEELWRE